MTPNVTHAQLVPELFVDYSANSEELRRLIIGMPSSEIADENKIGLRHIKVDTRYLWFVLAALKYTFGYGRFNQCVGIRLWDGGLVMIDSQMLTDQELISALLSVKKLLKTYDLDPAKGSLHKDFAHTCIWYLCDLHEQLRNRTKIMQPRIPQWENIKPDMDLTEWL